MALPDPQPTMDAALSPLAPGTTICISNGATTVEIAPQAGGRIAQIVHDGVEWLVGHDQNSSSMLAWGSYPMLPWAGRVRHGKFRFMDRGVQLPCNLGGHAIHGVGFGLPWQVLAHNADNIELALPLPQDERWPFGGHARQSLHVKDRALQLQLSLTADTNAMPAVIGWHPWFRKPERLQFTPTAYYRRDADGIATLPLLEPPPGPWDDCFINQQPVLLQRAGQCLRLTSDCTHWVVYDEPEHATCVEPQSGPADAFNLQPTVLAAGQTLRATMLLEWL